MKNLNFIKTFLSVAVFAALAAMAADVNAQGRYSQRYSKRDVSNIIKSLETDSDRFANDFKRAMNNNRQLGSSPAGQRFTRIVLDFENAIDRLRKDFDRNNNWWDARNQVERAVTESQNVNSMMNSLPFRRDLERQWNSLRNSMNRLADTYDLPGLNGGGWNGGGGGGWNGGGWGGGGGWNGNTQPVSPPSWARGTFYARLSNGSPITLTISSNGSVSANVNGQYYSGAYTRNGLFLNGDMSTVSRMGDGIRTVNRNSGEVTNYSRNWSGGGGGGGPWNPGMPGATTPPNWARGTFTSRLNNGSYITLTIANNGSVSANVNGQFYTGTYSNGSIYLNGDVSRVTRQGNGIRTVNNNTGEVTNYSRR